MNIYEQIDSNKRRSFLIMAGFSMFVIGFVWLMGYFLGSDRSIIFMAAIFSLVSSFGSYFWGDKVVLAISKASPATRKDYFNFYTAAENLAIAAQIPVPKLYVIKSAAMNAFATGRDPKHAVVCATTGLLEKLNKTEIEAVIAHEISHITNYDMLLMTITAVLVGMVSLLSDWLLRASRFGFGGRDDDDRRGVNPLTLVFGIITLIVAPIAARLVQLALSRRREYFADASAVKLTKQPTGLISALEKLRDYNLPLATASSATAHLFIVNPFANVRGGLHKLAAAFSTHPPIEERIAVLEKML